MESQEAEARFQHRRRIAQWSFVFLSATLVVVIGFALTSDEAAARVSAIQWLLGTATGLWSTLILGYYAAASYEQGRIVQK